jgi:hypothetical protein
MLARLYLEKVGFKLNNTEGANEMKIKVLSIILAIVLLASLFPAIVAPAAYASESWTAFNDCAGTTAGNVTGYTVTSGNTTGVLKNYATGDNTPVTVTFTSTGRPQVQTGSYGGDETDAGTDAYNTFHGFADMAGVIQYGDSGWYVDMAFTGLDPAGTYTFATSGNRGSSDYASRIAKFTLSGVEAATNASTPGVTVENEYSVSFSTGYNTVNGYVARWTGIQPGSDGSFTVRAEAGTSERRAYGPSVFMLQEESQAGPVPDAPAGLTATEVSSTQIDLGWTDNSDDESGFKIERKTGSGGNYTQVDTVGTDVTAYTDRGVSPGTEYYYRIRAYNAGGNSDYSNEASATTLPSSITWTSYNDCAWDSGQIDTKITTYTIPEDGTATGLLKNYDTGDNTPVTVTFSSNDSPFVQTDPDYGGDETDAGTDAYNTFHGFADMAGVIVYGDSGWYVDMAFTGLDPAGTYTFATSGNRDDSSYANRITKFTLSGVEAATNASTPGVTVENEYSVSFSTGYNTVNGYVARWTGIQPGSDGSFTVRAEAGTSEYKAYGPSVFMLQEEGQTGPAPSVITLEATDVSQNSALLKGGLTDMGDYDEVSVNFQYRTAGDSGVTISNPYAEVDFGTYNIYKSNLHTHTDQSDGSLTVSNAIGQYSDKGYDILAITDHDSFGATTATTWPWTSWISQQPSIVISQNGMETSAYYPGLGSDGMLAVRGNELSAGDHTGSLFSDLGYSNNPGEETYLADIASKGGMAIFNHPGRYSRSVSWYNSFFDAYFSETLAGLEVYNQGDRYTTDRVTWDNVNRERDYDDLIWGLSNDDMHTTSQLFRNYNRHYMSDLTEAALRDNMQEGAFTFSYEPGGSGDAVTPVLTNVAINGSEISLECTNHDGIIWYNDSTTQISTSATIDVTDFPESKFVRAVMQNASGRTYTQPFGYTLTGSNSSGGEWINTEKQTFTSPAEFSQMIEGLDPQTEYEFRAVVEWNGETGYGEKKTFTTTDAEVQYALIIDSTSGGSVTEPGEGVYIYSEGTRVDLAAEAEEGYRFVNWTGDVDTIDNVDEASTTLIMNDHYSITANFALNQYTIVASASPAVGGSVEGAGVYTHGDTVNLTTTANTGYSFLNWTENGQEISTEDSYSFTATGNRTLAANFIPGELVVTRTLPEAVFENTTFQVKIQFTAPADDFNTISITDIVPPGWEAAVNTSWCSPSASSTSIPDTGVVQYTWLPAFPAGTVFTAVYEVTVPAGTTPGTYTFSGGQVEYSINGAGPFTAPVGGDSEVRWGSTITGITAEVNGTVIAGATVELYLDDILQKTATSDHNGQYVLAVTEPGNYSVTVSASGLRNETQQKSIPVMGEAYTLDFIGNSGLIPQAPDQSYVLTCTNRWLYPPADHPELALNMSKVQAVANAWLYS